MSILNRLTIKNLRLNKKRTIVTIIGIILSTALMVGIGLLFSSFQDLMIRDTIGYSGKYEAKYNDVDLIKLNDIKNKNFTYFYEKPIGFSKIESSNEYKPYMYITSVNKEYFNELKLVDGSFPKNENEVVISNHVITNGGLNYKVGDIVTFKYGKRNIEGNDTLANSELVDGEFLTNEGTYTYKIVGIVERSNFESYSASGYTAFTVDVNSDKGNVNLYVMFNKNKNIIKQSEELAKELNYNGDINYNSTLLALYGESTYGNVMSSMGGMMIIMLSLVSIGCIIVIYNSFAISVMERKKEFGLLSSIGATKKQLAHTVFFEAVVVGVIGIILGILGAYIGIGCVILIINNLISDMLEYKLHLVTNPLFIIIPVIFMIIVIGVSAFIPSRRASKVSPIEAIRQNDDIKINKKKIRTSKLVLKLFGIEGEIALKNIKRNKKKYRVTIVSLFISIVLFISFSSYMNYTLNTASSVMGEVPYDYQISYFGDDPNNDKEALDKINEIVKSSDVKEYVSYSVSNLSIIGNYTYSDEYLDFYKSAYGENGIKALNNLKYQYISIYILDDNSYNKYKKLIGLDKDSVILLNKFKGVSYGNNKRVNYNIPVINNGNINIKICNFDDNDEDVDTTKYCNKNIDNIFVTNKSFDLIEEFSYMDDFKLIVNKKLYDSISDSSTHYTQFNIISDNTNNIDKLTKDLDKYSNVNYTNVKEAMKQANNLILVVKILMYGFISLVTLIGVTSVFNTISTSMALRKREFAVLRSIGLTNRGFNKILFFESLFFGMKSLIFAIPVSIGITVLIHYALADMVSISTIIIPWKYIIISIVSVFVIVLLTMIYSTSKIKKHNIIEQIREENI
ncbi:MAG: FtsX-like permease family protein [Bacilli bacterium]|nr:FtsX-like permease family protein [Bacilli bacterium]